MTESEGPAKAPPPAPGGEPDDRDCRFNPLANRHEWWVPGHGFTGEPCDPDEDGDGGSGTGDT